MRRGTSGGRGLCGDSRCDCRRGGVAQPGLRKFDRLLEAFLRQLGKSGLRFGSDFAYLPRVGTGLVGGKGRQAVLHVEDLAQVPAGQQRLHPLLAFVEGCLRGLQVQLGDPLEAGKQDAGVGEAVSEAAAVTPASCSAIPLQGPAPTR